MDNTPTFVMLVHYSDYVKAKEKKLFFPNPEFYGLRCCFADIWQPRLTTMGTQQKRQTQLNKGKYSIKGLIDWMLDECMFWD